MALRLTVAERFKGHKLIAVTSSASGRTRVEVIVVATSSDTLKAGQTQTVRIALNRAGKRLLAHRHSLRARLRITRATGTGAAVSVASQVVTFKAAKKGDPHRAR